MEALQKEVIGLLSHHWGWGDKVFLTTDPMVFDRRVERALMPLGDMLEKKEKEIRRLRSLLNKETLASRLSDQEYEKAMYHLLEPIRWMTEGFPASLNKKEAVEKVRKEILTKENLRGLYELVTFSAAIGEWSASQD